jgi:hypothetical protein
LLRASRQKFALLHMDVRMLRAQDAQEQPFAGGNEAAVRKKRRRRLFSNELGNNYEPVNPAIG